MPKVLQDSTNKYKHTQVSFLFSIQSGSHIIIITLSMRTLCVTCLFCLQLNIVKQMTIHSLSHRKPCTHTQAHPHTHFIEKKSHSVEKYNKTITLMNEFHLSFTPMVFSIRHKTILPQQMHSAVHIIIIRHLNHIHVLARHAVPNGCSCIFTHPGRKALFKITYTLIYYTLKMHLYAVFLPLTHSSPSPAFSHVGGRTGHPAMPHQYAW